MANTAFLTASVGSILTNIKVFKSYPKIGKITFAFLSQGQRDNQGIVTGNTIKFVIAESDDGLTWSQVGTTVVLPPGAQKVTTVISHKGFLRLSGVGETGTNTTLGVDAANAGGSAKVDITHNGIQYFGQLDPDASNGKSGFGAEGGSAVAVDRDGNTLPGTNGIGSYGATAYPESPSF